MEFRDYAAKETAALFSRLLASQAEALYNISAVFVTPSTPLPEG